jgi:hypothetical protein
MANPGGWRPNLRAAWANVVGEAAPEPVIDIVGPVSEETRRRFADLCAETPVPADRIGKHLRIARLEDHVFAKNAVLSLSDIRWPDSIRYGFFELADAIVTPFGFLIKDDALVFNTQILPNGWMKGGLGGSPEIIRRIFEHNFIHKLDIWRETCLLSLPADLETIAEPAFLFNSRLTWCNFAHLVHDTLVQTPTYLDACGHAGENVIPLLVGPGFHYPAGSEIFARSVGAKTPRFLKNRFYRVPRLFVPTTHFSPSNDAIARGAVARLMQNLSFALAECRTQEKRRIFISREDSSRGDDREPRFANADALHSALAEIGVESVVVSRLGVEDYLRTFVNCELIVGLHGAGLLNAVLCENPRVLEINVPGYPDWRSLSLFYETGMGAPSRRVVMPPPENGVASYDIPAVVEACKGLLATPPSCPPPALPL